MGIEIKGYETFMKRVLLVIDLGLIELSSGFGLYELFSGDFIFSRFKMNSLYPDAVVNTHSSTSALNFLFLAEGQPRYIKYADENMNVQLKTRWTSSSSGFQSSNLVQIHQLLLIVV